MTENQTYYVSGLSDALEIIKEQLEDGLKIGEKYFVLMQTDRMSDDIYVDEMILYRINQKKKTSYCFTRDGTKPTPDLILYSKNGLHRRIFDTYEEANRNIPLYACYLRERRERYGY